MDTLSHPKTMPFCSSTTKSINIITKVNPCVVKLPLYLKRYRSKVATRCASLELFQTRALTEALRAVERDLEEEEGWERWKEKCKERKGLVELLECLEREAIMGEDEGRDPGDYNRRAHIFDKSSRVFQALKVNNLTTPNDDDQTS